MGKIENDFHDDELHHDPYIPGGFLPRTVIPNDTPTHVICFSL